jgi:hypothetical protein
MFFKRLHRVIEIGHLLIGLVFVLCALALLVFALLRLWSGIDPLVSSDVGNRVDEILSGIAVLTVALATLELGQTIVEEEVQRATVMSAPTRVRRFLSRFMIVLVVALSIEALVDVFQYSHTDPSMLPNAALIGFMAAVLLAAWGLFIRLNRSVEEMEPEALQRVREEDKRVKAEGLGAAGATVDEELSDEGF